VLEVMSDGRFHPAKQLAALKGLKPGDWVVAIRELIDYGYVFARRSHSLAISTRDLAAKAQDLTDLLAGIDARIEEDQGAPDSSSFQMGEHNLVEPEPADDGEAEEPEPVFDNSLDLANIDEADRILLSVDERGCVLPGKLTVTATQAVLAMKRSGKTYLAMVMVEEFLRLGLPFVVLDPTGAWRGIRSLVDGSPAPWKVLVVGGSLGDLPLLPSSGAKVADLVVAMWPQSLILDLSDLGPEEQHLVVADLCARLYVVNRRPLHVIFDEADEWAPQTPNSSFEHQKRCLNSVDRFVRRGGVKGLGGTLITQRPAAINKNVLSQVGRTFFMSMTAPHDLEAAESWIEHVIESVKHRRACLDSLPRLSQGEAFAVTNVGTGKISLVKFKVRQKLSFDSSRTPTMDAEVIEPQPSRPNKAELDRAWEILGRSIRLSKGESDRAEASGE
jgi:hypothetical protein